MKYMGSKRYMLSNGLGEIIHKNVSSYERFVDLFAGSSAVGCHVAERYRIPVHSNDLQSYSSALANGIITRTEPSSIDWVIRWIEKIRSLVEGNFIFKETNEIQKMISNEPISVVSVAARNFCLLSDMPVVSSYGGYYFSPLQALVFDTCRQNLPKDKDRRAVALSALIQAASVCCAAPGHTAQPFKPNDTAGPYIVEAWKKCPFKYIENKCVELSSRHAKVRGQSSVLNSNDLASQLKPGDLVFLDPPYSGVHYSRFYHVLETIARGQTSQVSGAGRYPPPSERPSSDYSMRSTSFKAMSSLLSRLAESGCSAILTYPSGDTSNGLNGDDVVGLVDKFFNVTHSNVKGKFSTLGGNTRNRTARIASDEMLILMKPKRARVKTLA